MTLRNTMQGAVPIRWGILGTGGIARQFAEGLRELPEAQLLAVGSRTLAAAQDFAQAYRVPRAYGSYQALVEDGEVDVVYIATPHIRHRDDCLLCLQAGKAVLCEKPLALNARQAEEIITLARERQLFCMEAMWMRFMPLIQRVKQLIDQGAIGEVLCLTAEFGYPTEFDPENRFFNPQLGGGALLDRGSYPLTLAFYLLGCPETVTGQAHLGSTGVDEQCGLVLSYRNGAIAQLFASLRAYTSNTATITGTTGKIVIHPPFCRPDQITLTPLSSDPVVVTSQAQPHSPSSGLKHQLSSWVRQNRLTQQLVKKLRDKGQVQWQPIGGNGLNYEAAEVMTCLRQGKSESPIMPLQESLQLVQLMDELRHRWGLYYPQD
jgi:predicted dehydrogenase